MANKQMDKFMDKLMEQLMDQRQQLMDKFMEQLMGQQKQLMDQFMEQLKIMRILREWRNSTWCLIFFESIFTYIWVQYRLTSNQVKLIK